MNRIENWIIKLTPKAKFISRLCSSYLNKYENNNNCEMETNGELYVMKKFLPKSQTVFDVGANIGDWSKLALEINPKLNIHCFEPSKYTYKKLKENIGSKVNTNNSGLSSQNKTETLHIFEDGEGMNSIYKRIGLVNLQQNKTEAIELKTLDEYCQNKNITHINFMKVDVEGHELEVFKGSKSMLHNNCISIIQFEYGGCNIDSGVFLKDIFGFFENLNYVFYKIYHNKLMKVENYKQTLDNFQYQNWLIINKNFSF